MPRTADFHIEHEKVAALRKMAAEADALIDAGRFTDVDASEIDAFLSDPDGFQADQAADKDRRKKRA